MQNPHANINSVSRFTRNAFFFFLTSTSSFCSWAAFWLRSIMRAGAMTASLWLMSPSRCLRSILVCSSWRSFSRISLCHWRKAVGSWAPSIRSSYLCHKCRHAGRSCNSVKSQVWFAIYFLVLKISVSWDELTLFAYLFIHWSQEWKIMNWKYRSIRVLI